MGRDVVQRWPHCPRLDPRSRSKTTSATPNFDKPPSRGMKLVATRLDATHSAIGIRFTPYICVTHCSVCPFSTMPCAMQVGSVIPRSLTWTSFMVELKATWSYMHCQFICISLLRTTYGHVISSWMDQYLPSSLLAHLSCLSPTHLLFPSLPYLP